jgi:hypothetical protein
MANKYMKKCSTFLAIKEMQIKVTQRLHLTPVRKANIKRIQTTTNGGKDAGGTKGKELFRNVVGNVD